MSGIEPGFEPRVELLRVGAQTELRVGAGRIDDDEFDQTAGQQTLDIRHRRQQPRTLRIAERREERPRELVAQPIEQRPLGPTRVREPCGANAPVVRVLLDQGQAGLLERAQDPAEVPGVEVEKAPERPHLCGLGADLPEHSCFAERPLARHELIVEGADALGDGAVKPSDRGDCCLVHRLTPVS